jgi:uncharacterized HAD superfamily protein
MKSFKIGLDIDGVLANFIKAWYLKYPDINPNPTSYHIDDKFEERFVEMHLNNTLNDFFLNIPPLQKSDDIPFEPHCYITSRDVPSEVSKQWLLNHGFPDKPVHSIGRECSKIDVAKKSGIDVFVDDYIKNYQELNNAGITTYLYSACNNLQYDVGNMRINSLKELLHIYNKIG